MMSKHIRSFLAARQPSARAALVAVAVAPMAARADTIDTSSITTALTGAGTAAAAVGAAYLVVVVGIKAYKLIRAAL